MSKKKLVDPTKIFSPEEIAVSIAEAKHTRDIKNHRHRKAGQKVGRNDYCPCGSGKKNKFCCNARRVSRDGKKFHTIQQGYYS